MSVAEQTSTAERVGVELWEQWTALWNGDLSIAEGLLSPDFRIHFGNTIASADTDDFRGPADLAGFVAAHRAARPGLHYETDGVPIVAIQLVDGAPTGRLASRWTVTRPDAAEPGGTIRKSGIDLLAIDAGWITSVWSITGDRPFG